MRSISPQHKKGVSELISYTLLIILAVAASVLVYNYLKLTVPKDKPTCPDGSSLIMSNYNCTFAASSLSITLLNKGRFTIDAAYLRIGKVNDSARKAINKNNEFLTAGGSAGLKPNDEQSYVYSFSNTILSLGASNYSLEIQPAMIDDATHKLAACTPFVQTITCN
ncbi:MAG: hypothetical protein WCK29_03545 [archaeon]